MDATTMSHIVGAIGYSALGLIVFVAGFVIFDKITPGNMWKEIIEEKNSALAILCGAFALGIAIIISSAIKG